MMDEEPVKYNTLSCFIPMLSTEEGSCLTAKNWQDLGISTVAYDLASLLMKPGFELLNDLNHFKQYVSWSGQIALNATRLNASEQGYSVRSIYDGSYQYYSIEALLNLLIQLNPEWLLLPQGMQHVLPLLPNTIMPFIHEGEFPCSTSSTIGVYFFYTKERGSITAFLDKVKQYSAIPRYVVGELELSLIQELKRIGVDYIESNIPARDGSQGLMYNTEGGFSLKALESRLNFDLIQKDCDCPTCALQFTRAYLHHLLEHTPLLCQRLLIQHNIRFTSAVNPDMMCHGRLKRHPERSEGSPE